MAVQDPIPAEWLDRSAIVVYALRDVAGAWQPVSVTANIRELTGFAADEVLAKDWWIDHLHPDDLERMLARQKQLRSGDLATDDYRILHRDGRTLWIRDQRRRLGDGDEERIVGTWSDITQLRETEARYRALFESNPQPMWVYDLETLAFLAVNDAAIARYGYSREEFLALTIRDIRPAADLARLANNLTQTNSGFAASGEWRHRCKSGELLDVEITSHSLQFDGCEARMVLAYDLSERKRSERALRSSEAQLAKAQRIANLGSWTWHIPSNRVEWSAQMYRIFGIDEGQFEDDLDKIVATSIHPDDRARVERVNLEVARTGRAEPLQYRVVRPDGSVRVVWGEAGELVVDCEGRPERLSGIVQDITERTQAEAERGRLAAAIEQSSEAIILTDAAGTIQYVNPAFERVSGYTRAEAIGRNPRLLNSGAQSRAFYRQLWQTIASGETWRGRLINRRKDGSLFTEEAAISPMLGADGEIVSYVAVKRDITAELEVESQLRQAQKMEAIGSLAGGIAHDFNNMLGVILGNAELALSQASSLDPLRDRLLEIRKAAERSAQLTRQLLAFARKQTATPRALDRNETVESLLKMMRRLIGEGIELRWEPAAGLWPVWVDPVQIDQILANLCVNARDAIVGVGTLVVSTANVVLEPGRSPGLAGGGSGDYVRLDVRDSGCGMSPEILGHVFEPFFTTKEVGRGTGLGLATVYGIVQQNHGLLSVDSAPGEGTTFSIFLPRHTGATTRLESASEERQHLGRGETVLVVEDELALLHVLAKMLQREGFRPLKAAGPEAALAIAESSSERIDLVLTDIVMPGMNGHDLAARLRAVRPGTPCLFMSGYTGSAIAHDAALGVDVHFIHKPFSGHELAAKLREVLAPE